MSTAEGGSPRGHLAGLRVLDFSLWRPGPHATGLLARAGAEVISVEPPGGDPMRSYPALFDWLNAGKRSVLLDLKDGRDRARAHHLARRADVVVEGFRPGVTGRLGIDEPTLRALQPSLVYCSVTGYGASGPLAGAPGHDLNYLAWSGALCPEGGPPREPAVPVADLAAATTAALAVVTSVLRRLATGRGDHIDLAMADVLTTWTGSAPPVTAADLEAAPQGELQPGGTEHSGAGAPSLPGYGLFETADGCHVALGVVNERHFWRSLCSVLGLEAHAEADPGEHSDRSQSIRSEVARAVAARRRDDLVRELLEADVPAAPVLDRQEMLHVPHFRARGAATAPTGATTGTTREAGAPDRVTVQPSWWPAIDLAPAPTLDQHRGTDFPPGPSPFAPGATRE